MSDNEIPWKMADSRFRQFHGMAGQSESVPDILATMFAKQQQHMSDYAEIYRGNGYKPLPETLFGDFKARRTHDAWRDTLGYLIEELNEARNHLKAKPWKQTWREPDMEAFREELADAWHFFIELMIISGMTPSDVFEQYFKKALENDNRKASGY